MSTQITPEALVEIFKPDSYDHFEVAIGPNRIEVKQMYDYVELNIKKLLALAKLIGTDRFKVDSDSLSGCKTCDYGSQYTKTFTWKTEDVGQWDIKL